MNEHMNSRKLRASNCTNTSPLSSRIVQRLLHTCLLSTIVQRKTNKQKNDLKWFSVILPFLKRFRHRFVSTRPKPLMALIDHFEWFWTERSINVMNGFGRFDIFDLFSFSKRALPEPISLSWWSQSVWCLLLK